MRLVGRHLRFGGFVLIPGCLCALQRFDAAIPAHPQPRAGGAGTRRLRKPHGDLLHPLTGHRKRLDDFAAYARMWLSLIARFGGTHHGYFLPGEGPSDEALCLFSFPSPAAYEDYRRKAASDEDAKAAVRFAEERGLLLEWERSFYRPVLG